MTTVCSSKTLVCGTNSSWSVYIQNGASGGDVHSEPDFLAAALGVRCFSIVMIEDVPKVRLGSMQFVFREGDKAIETQTRHGVQRHSPTRAVAVTRESGWEFSAHGDPLPFEEVESYSEKRIKDRLTVDMIERYARKLGVDVFNTDFCSGPTYIVGGVVPANAVTVPRFPNQ